jgi:hypothetical protein
MLPIHVTLSVIPKHQLPPSDPVSRSTCAKTNTPPHTIPPTPHSLYEKSFGKHFSFVHSFPSCVSACCSSCVLFVLTISRRQFWHYSNISSSHPLRILPEWDGAYDGHGLGRLNRQTVGLDGGTGASLIGSLVFARDLLGVSFAGRNVWGREADSVFLGDGHRGCGGGFEW